MQNSLLSPEKSCLSEKSRALRETRMAKIYLLNGVFISSKKVKVADVFFDNHKSCVN